MKLFNPFLIAIFIFILGGFVFKSMTPTKCSTILPFDYMFVLTGDLKRIPFAINKLRKYPKSTLHIIGAGSTSQKYKKNGIIIESKSKNTYQNALSIKKIVDKEGLDRILLITSDYHIGRARLLIRQELPDIEIALCPVSSKNLNIKKQLELWMLEYVKYIGTLFGFKES